MNKEVHQLEETVNSEPSASPPPQLGELLIAARERWDLSAADLARQLRLGLRQVQALEENRFEDLPGNTFVRGFVRNYARVVQTDPAVFLAAYEQHKPQLQQPSIEHNAEHIAFQRKTPPKWVWYLIALLLLALVTPLLIYLVLHDDDAAPKPFKPASSSTPSKLNTILESAGVVPMTLPPPQAVLQQASSNAASATQATLPIAPEKPLPAVTTTPVSGEANIQLSFDGDAWVEIRDQSGKIVFSQLNRRGDVQVVTGKRPFAVVVGNAGKVRIAYNGKPFDFTPFVNVSVARFKLE